MAENLIDEIGDAGIVTINGGRLSYDFLAKLLAELADPKTLACTKQPPDTINTASACLFAASATLAKLHDLRHTSRLEQEEPEIDLFLQGGYPNNRSRLTSCSRKGKEWIDKVRPDWADPNFKAAIIGDKVKVAALLVVANKDGLKVEINNGDD